MKIVNVMAMSVDGHIACHSSEGHDSRLESGFTNAEDQAHLAQLVGTADAVVVGAQSLRVEQSLPKWNGRRGSLFWYVFSHGEKEKLAMTQDLLIAAGAEFSFLCNSKGGGRDSVVPFTEESLRIILEQECRVRQHEKVLLLGGSEINALFYRCNLVDELILTVSPVIQARPHSVALIAKSLSFSIELSLIDVKRVADSVFLHYKVDDVSK